MLILNEEINIARNVTYEHVFYAMDNDGSIINLTPYTASMHLKKSVGDILSTADFTQYLDTVTYAADGIVLLSIPYADTNFTFNKAVFDLKLKHTLDNKVYEIAQGTVSVRDTVTLVN